MSNTKCYWFEVTDENSDVCGEEFFVEIDVLYEPDPLSTAWDTAAQYFNTEELTCHGAISTFQAEMMGLDTY